MTPPPARIRVAVLGGSGFIGAPVLHALERRGAVAVRLPAPRLDPVPPDRLVAAVEAADAVVEALAVDLADVDVVVNAAGRANPGSDDLPGLLAANAVLPGVVARAAASAGVNRLVHVSSAAVQGAGVVLDSSPVVRPFSAYSASKAAGEKAALRYFDRTVVHRPASVHGRSRAATASLVALARSRLASVAGDGSAGSPQALVENVADAAAFLALSQTQPPPIVHQPAEGLTSAEVLRVLSEHEPWHVPRSIAGLALWTMSGIGTVSASWRARARRLDVLWFGQEQAPSWLTDAGWVPVAGVPEWRALGRDLARR